MATAIKAKYKLIDKKRISQQAKDILDELSEATNEFKDVSPALRKEFNAFYKKLKSAKPEAIRGTKEYKAFGTEGAPKPSATPEPSKKFREALKKSREARRLQGLSTSTEDIKKDAGRPALKAGKRISRESGKTYYEYRENRIDRRPARYPKLEQGGKIQSIVDSLWNGYASAILFAETDSDTEESLDSNYSISDFDNKTVEESKSMLKKFYLKNKKAIEDSGLSLNVVGMDVWYTRKGHGAGFYDHSLDDDVEKQLIDGAKALGQFPDVETHEGKIYVRGGRKFKYANGGGIDSQPNLFDMHTTEEHRAESEPQMVRTQFEEEAFEYGDGGGVKNNYKINLRFKGLSGSQSEIGNYVVSKRTLDKLENMYSFGVSIDVIDETNEKTNNYDTVANDISNKYDSLLGKFALGGRPKSAIMRDRAYQSEEPWEKNYKRSGKPKHPKYKFQNGGKPSAMSEKTHQTFLMDAERIADVVVSSVNNNSYTEAMKKEAVYYKQYLLELVISELESRV